MKEIIIILLCIILIALIIVICYGGNYLYNLGINPKYPKDLIFKSNTDEETKQSETSGVSTIDSKTWLLKYSNYEDLFINSKDNLKLHNFLIKNENKSNKWVIAVHGYTSQGTYMASYAQNFYDMGYNVIIPDLRGHGKSEGNYIGMGWDERFDIIDLIKKVNANPSQLATLITDVDLSGYHLLTEIQDLSIYEVSTHKLLPKQKDVTVTWEVPNLVNTLKNVKVLHYSTVRNTWEILTPSKVDFENKSITQHFDDLSPVAVIYKLNDTNKSDADKNKDSKKTGDTTNVVPYVVVGIVALVEVVFFVVKKKKND